nr:E3 UFM1-protein ligase 1 homolog [Ipomoea batatas]
MDEELLELQRQFEFAQQAKSTVRLSDRNVVELVQKLQQLQILDFDLLHTVTGKEFITPVKGRLEGGQLYTPAYVARVNAMVREMDGAGGVAVEKLILPIVIINGIVKEGEILGALRAGVHWTPSVFAMAQKRSVLTLSFHRIDSLSVLLASFGSQDASKILSLCPSVQTALKSNKALILGESYVFSNGFVKDLFDSIEKELETLNLSMLASSGTHDELHASKGTTSSLADSNETGNDGGGNKQAMEKGSKKKKGKSAGNTRAGAAEAGLDNLDSAPSKSKKNQKKGKGSSTSQEVSSKLNAKKEEDPSYLISEEWITQKIVTLNPDFEEQDDPETLLEPLAHHLRPLLVNSWKERKKAAFTENAQKMKKLLDNLQRKLDESFLNMQLYEKALDLFEDDQSTSILLHKHLLRTTGTFMVDTLLLNLDVHNKLKNGIEVDESQNREPASLNSGDRNALAKNLPRPLSVKATALLEALEGKRVEMFMTALRALAEESGLILKKLDKKLERTLLHSYRKDLTTQVSAETDAVSLLPKVVSLLYVQVHGKALQAPGRAISAAVSGLKDKLDDSAFKTLTDYQSTTVSLLALMSAATGDEEDCSTDRIQTKREVLEGLMPALKGLVLSSQQS